MTEVDIASNILEVVNPKLSGCRIRFGRTHKIPNRFVGNVRSVRWDGPTKRRGGAFVLICDYNNLYNQEHRVILKQMLQDYSEQMLFLKKTNTKPAQKRRKPFQPVQNTAINTTNDLEIEIDGQWTSYGTYLPTCVRELQPIEVEKWLMIHTQSGISTNRENAPITLEDVDIEETYTSSDSTNTSVSQDESIYMEYISDSRQNVPIHDTITNHTQVSSTSYVPDFVSHIPISNNPTDNYQIREILNRQLSAVVAQLVKIGMGPYTVNNVLTNAKSQIEQSGLIWY